MLPSLSGILAEATCTSIRPEFRVSTDSFLLFVYNQLAKIYGPLSFILSLCATIRPKIRVLIYLFNFICTWWLDKIIWSPFIYSFFCAQPFDLKLGPSLMYFFYLHTAIRQKYMIFFHSIFLCAWPFDKKLGSSLIYFFYLHTTIQSKIRVLIKLSKFYFAQD